VAHKEDRQQQAHLGGILRAAYQPVVEETLPERLRDLLDALDGREMKSRLHPGVLSATVSRTVDATVGLRSPEPASPDRTDTSLHAPQLLPGARSKSGPPDEER
jgi:hypothetical protein